MKEHAVTYQSGESRYYPGVAVDYMLAKVNGVELYAESVAEDDDGSATYDVLQGLIIEQAQAHGIDPDSLQFG